KNPLPNTSHAATLVQRQTQRRDKFQECDRPLFSTDPDFENVTDIVPIMKSFPPSYSSFVNSQQAARQKFRHARAKIDALSAARNVPRPENGATRTAHRPRPSCRGPGRCKTNLPPAFRSSARPSSGTRHNRTRPARHVPLRKKRRRLAPPHASTISIPVHNLRDGHRSDL